MRDAIGDPATRASVRKRGVKYLVQIEGENRFAAVGPWFVLIGAMTGIEETLVFNRLEELSLDCLAELCGLHAEMNGVYSSGGSVAELDKLGAARP